MYTATIIVVFTRLVTYYHSCRSAWYFTAPMMLLLLVPVLEAWECRYKMARRGPYSTIPWMPSKKREADIHKWFFDEVKRESKGAETAEEGEANTRGGEFRGHAPAPTPTAEPEPMPESTTNARRFQYWHEGGDDTGRGRGEASLPAAEGERLVEQLPLEELKRLASSSLQDKARQEKTDEELDPRAAFVKMARAEEEGLAHIVAEFAKEQRSDKEEYMREVKSVRPSGRQAAAANPAKLEASLDGLPPRLPPSITVPTRCVERRSRNPTR